MTDYGRGSGSEPWPPEDPLFGDAYDQGQGYQQPQHPQQQGEWQDPYATGQQQPYYPQQGGGQQYPEQQYPQQGQPQQGHPQQPYQQQPQQQGYQQQGYDGYDTGGHPINYGGQDPYGGHQPQDPYATGQQQTGYYGQNGYPQQHPQQPQQPQYQQQPQQQGYQQQPGVQQPQPGQPGQPQPGQPGQPQQGRGQQPLQGRQQEPGRQPLRTAPANTGDWGADDESDPHDHAFFANDDDDDDDDGPATSNPTSGGGRRAGRSQPKGTKKRRSGCACLVVLLVLGGGLAGGVYYGYGVYQDHFGPAPDYKGEGAGDAQVEIPKGSTLTAMGNILKDAGVVKSVGAFTSAASKNPKAQSIQAGVYVLHLKMSASSAVAMMLDPKSQNALIIPEGWRATRIYQAIDTKLGLKAGTTAAQVKGVNVGLPSWAGSNIEGFLFPAKYSVAKTMKPVDLVKQMVKQADAEYTRDDIVNEAKKVDKSPKDILKIASLVQAEAQEDDDFGKVSRVIYNRLDVGQPLEFDSTLNYAMGRSTLNTTNKDTHFKSPYNTYDNKGLPPGPIDNPGHMAIQAALHPTVGKWLYFVTVKPGDTRFSDTFAEHQKNVQDFNQYQKDHG
jgi:UPF0755 protein